MPFSYQKSIFEATENVTSPLLHQLLREKESAEKVDLIRKIKTRPEDSSWASHWRYQDWQRHLSADRLKALEGKSSSELALVWADSLKRSLPLVIFIANFDETLREYRQKPGQPKKEPKMGRWRKKEGLRLNGLCVMDLDHVVESHNPDDVRRWWEMVSAHLDMKELGILFVYVSASGDGAKVVFKARMEWGNLIDNQMKMAQFLGVSQYVDEKCKDGSRGHFITTEDDVIYLDESEIYAYYNETFFERYNALYRDGRTQATKETVTTPTQVTSQAAAQRACPPLTDESPLVYNGVAVEKIIEALLGGVAPQDGTRHDTMRDLAMQLRYICDNTPKKILEALETQQWVRDLIAEGDPVEATVDGACRLRYYLNKPQRLQQALLATGALKPMALQNADDDMENMFAELPLGEWGEKISSLFNIYPCLREICRGLPLEDYAAATFTAAAFLGTDMTRTWYHFYHRPEEERRLNYCIYIIGDPGNGKSFAGRLKRLLAAPIVANDQLGNDAINRYKKALKERETSTKEQKKDALKEPEVMIRIHGTRTANGVFIEDMKKAVDYVGDKPINLHLLTFDAELDSSKDAASGGQWINKNTMELKAFHNEEDSQQYKNRDSVTGPFNVYWNYIFTGTPLSLRNKITERNFGSGLATRLACIPLPPDYDMMPYSEYEEADKVSDDLLVSWAYRLDKVSGELPIWPLVRKTWECTNYYFSLAKVNGNFKADRMLALRVAYYGIAITVPFILMRHWEEWNTSRTLSIDDTDLDFCELVMDIQYTCQQFFFGEYARNYFANQKRDVGNMAKHGEKMRNRFNKLGNEFSQKDIMELFSMSEKTASPILLRWVKEGLIERTARGIYKKLVSSI